MPFSRLTDRPTGRSSNLGRYTSEVAQQSRQAFDANVFEIPDAARIVGLEGDGAAGGIEEPAGALGRALHVFGLGVVEHLLAIDGGGDAFAFGRRCGL